MRLFRNQIVVILIALSTFLSVRSCEERKVLDSCIDDLAHNCRGLYEYATALEDENARLNHLYRGCRDK
jgi:hypothetical protein